ncbi:GNAT family N-acetyltransferase [Streptomyces sp. NPDC023998]|uniref:GNAT family N-acetyltransferase n=1 Tax=Streptomyces sp. NPDC023998 TaxID=3154597 RepID=UPI0033C668C2
MSGTVELRHVDEEMLEGLLAVAVNDAAPDEVMPPVTGPPGWTTTRQDAFRAWHRARRPGLAGPLHECTFAILADGKIVGSARLACRDSQEVLETGMWLARSARGRGIGTAALDAILNEAARADARFVVAETTATNLAAIAALRRNDARLTTDQHTGHVHAHLPLDQAQPPPPASPARAPQ